MEVIKVPVDKILFSKEANARMNELERDIHGLMNSIKEEGCLQPIGVNKNFGGTYTIRFGNRRFIAQKKLGYKTIEVIPSEESINEVDFIIQNLTENYHRKNLSVIELGHGCKALQKEGLNIPEIVVRTGMSKIAIETAITLYDVIPIKYRPIVQFHTNKSKVTTAGTISATTARYIAKVVTRYHLGKEDVEKIFEYAREGEIPFRRISIIGFLMNKGRSLEKAIEQSEEYTIHELTIALRKQEKEELMKEYGTTIFASVIEKMLSKKISSLIVAQKEFSGKYKL